MPQNIYEPLKLSQTNRYAGYQFHACLHLDGMESSDAFRYLILTVFNWARQRMPEEDRNAPELQLPEAERYAEVKAEQFMPYHFSIGYALDITPLMNDGIWTLRLKEPDTGTKTREAVPGRMFTTRVGLRLNEKGFTELGIRIDVTDPASAEKEVDFAFRPSFVRSLAIQPHVHFEEIRELKRGLAGRIETDEEYRQFLYMLDNTDNQMPLVVFTHYRPEVKKVAPAMSMEEFVKNDQTRSFLQFSGVRMTGMGTSVFAEKAIEYQMPVMPGAIYQKMPARTVKVSAPPAAAGTQADPEPADAEPPVMPYSKVVKFGESAFGYAQTYVLGDRYLEKLRSRLKKEFGPGDILVCGARKFRGGVSVIAYPGDREEDLQKAYDNALLAAQSYSKHKAPYSYGSVVFEAEARKMEQHARVTELVNSSVMEDKDKIGRLKYETELLFGVIDDKDRYIEELKRQKDEEFERGRAFASNERKKVDEENAELRRKLAEQQNRIRQMEDRDRQARDILGVVGRMRSIEKIPATNEEVVRYFRLVYGDRLDFTERGAAEAAKCGLRPSSLWDILYTAANDLVDVFRSVQGNLTEDDVMKATGFEMSFREGSMTREQNDMMRLREDEYEGKTISVEPHLKIKSQKGEPDHQRLHFCYIPELRRIVVGYLGDHLDSASSRHVK